MELSTTNGHIPLIIYLFIKPICFPLLVHPAHSITVLAHTVNNLFLHKVKVGFQSGWGMYGPFRPCRRGKCCFDYLSIRTMVDM